MIEGSLVYNQDCTPHDSGIDHECLLLCIHLHKNPRKFLFHAIEEDSFVHRVPLSTDQYFIPTGKLHEFGVDLSYGLAPMHLLDIILPVRQTQ